jgi:hypothetical protein
MCPQEHFKWLSVPSRAQTDGPAACAARAPQAGTYDPEGRLNLSNSPGMGYAIDEARLAKTLIG